MRAIALLFAFVAAGAASAQTSAPCKLPLYVEAAHSATDATENLFLFGLKTAVMQHQGCMVDKLADAQLGLYISTLKISTEEGPTDSSVVAVTLAVPFHGVPVYMDNYALVIRANENVDGQVNDLLQRIGESLDRHSSPGQ